MQFKWNGPVLRAVLEAKARDRVEEAALFLVQEIKKTLTGGRSGRAYKVSRSGKLHIASAPGEPPAVLTGTLRNNITFSMDSFRPRAKVGPRKLKPDYPAMLQFGTSKMLARPYMDVTFTRVKSQVIAIMKKGWRL